MKEKNNQLRILSLIYLRIYPKENIFKNEDDWDIFR